MRFVRLHWLGKRRNKMAEKKILKCWKKTINEKDYKVWKNPQNKKIAIFKNSFVTPSGRRYVQKSNSIALKKAKAYMKKHDKCKI